MSERLLRYGNEAHYTEIEGGGHRFFPGENRRVVPWMLAQRRETPERFTYTTLDGNPAGLVYWVHAPGSDGVAATISRENREVKVTLQGERLPAAPRVFSDRRVGAEVRADTWAPPSPAPGDSRAASRETLLRPRYRTAEGGP